MKKHSIILCAIMALLLIAGCAAEPTTVTDMTGFTYSTASKEITITEYKGSATTAIIPEIYNSNPIVGFAKGAFKGSTLTDVTLPKGTTRVTPDAFIGSNVKSIAINGIGIKFASKNGILYDFKLHTLLVYPPKKEDISLTVEGTVNTIGTDAFKENAYLQSFTFDGSSIGASAFFKAQSLKSVHLTDTVSIGLLAFACTPLEEITLPETLTFIDQTALAECPSLKKITVKKGSYAHSWCIENGFESITVAQ